MDELYDSTVGEPSDRVPDDLRRSPERLPSASQEARAETESVDPATIEGAISAADNPGGIDPSDTSEMVVVPGGIPSSFRAGVPGLIQQLEFSSSSLPAGTDELKREVDNLSHTAITALTRGSSIPQTRPEDWLQCVKQFGYKFETMEQLLKASEDFLHALVLNALAVQNRELSLVFEELESRFSGLRARLRGEPVTASSATAPPGEARRFRKGGDFWQLAFDGAAATVRHTNGMEYIERLLMAPDRSFGCIELAQAASRFDRSSATVHAEDKARLSTGLASQPLQDPKTRTAIKNDLDRIEAELADAKAMYNEEQAEQLRTEREAILQYVRKSFGRGGRVRIFPKAEERARKAVSLAIQRAISMIAKVLPQMALHLTDRIDTGLECCYRSDGIVWEA